MSGVSSLEEKLNHYQNLLIKDPNSLAFAELADTYRRLGKLTEAKQICERGLKQNPTHSGAQLLLGQIFWELKVPAESEKQLLALIRRVPNHLLAHQMILNHYRELGKADSAKAIAARLIKLKPDDAIARATLQGVAPPKPAAPNLPTVTMAKLYEQQGHLEKAISIYQLLAAKDPELSQEIGRLHKIIASKKKIAILNKLLEVVRTERSQQ